MNGIAVRRVSVNTLLISALMAERFILILQITQ